MASNKHCKPFGLEKKCSRYTHVDKDGNMLYDSEGRPLTEPRYINTKDLVKSSGLRGTMSELQEKHKKLSKKVEAKHAVSKMTDPHNIGNLLVGATRSSSQVTSPVTTVVGPHANQSGSTQPPTVDLDIQPLPKRYRVDKGKMVQLEQDVVETPEGAVVTLPAIWTDLEKFGPKTTLRLSTSDSEVVEDLGPVGRSRAMTEGVIGMMKALRVAVSLNNKESEYKAQAEGLRGEKERLKAKVIQLEKACSLKDQKIKVLQKDLEEKNKDMAQLIDKNEELQNDLYDSVRYNFQNAIAQMKVKNPEVELQTEGISYLNEVKDGKVVPVELEEDE